MALKTEEPIQCAVYNYLCAALPPGSIVFHPPNGGTRRGGAWEGARLKAMGTLAGVPDLVILLPEARTLFMEIKAEKGRLSAPQKEFNERAQAIGFHTFVVRSIDDARAALEDAGIETREPKRANRIQAA